MKKKKKVELPDIPNCADFYMAWWLDINTDSSWLTPEKAKATKPKRSTKSTQEFE